jgi:hypothetical protein
MEDRMREQERAYSTAEAPSAHDRVAVQFLDGTWENTRDGLNQLKREAERLMAQTVIFPLPDYVSQHELMQLYDWVEQASGTPNSNKSFWVMVAFVHELKRRAWPLSTYFLERLLDEIRSDRSFKALRLPEAVSATNR